MNLEFIKRDNLYTSWSNCDNDNYTSRSSGNNYRIMIALLLLLLLTSCMKTEIINEVILTQDTIAVKPRKEITPPQEDTARVPIVFDVEVEDWDEKVVNL